MMTIIEYLLSKSKPKLSMIKATDKTIHKIVASEIERLGYDANLNHIDVSEVTDMSNLFNCNFLKYHMSKHVNMLKYRNHFNCDISKWDVSNVKNMFGTFAYNNIFNCDISEWHVSNVTNMNYMFCGCFGFNQDLSRWDIGNVSKYEHMFDGCPIKKQWKPKFKD